MTPGDPFDRVVPKQRHSHPPCPEDEEGVNGCWVRLGDGYRHTRPLSECCEFDEHTGQWTRCVPREQETRD